ncbi:hypothetical protein BDR04DRAFT_467089 [Suillus decipiens]|nr:hypothetical protein BDR04DRAFT_467089 [Suillus decipiens]
MTLASPLFGSLMPRHNKSIPTVKASAKTSCEDTTSTAGSSDIPVQQQRSADKPGAVALQSIIPATTKSTTHCLSLPLGSQFTVTIKANSLLRIGKGMWRHCLYLPDWHQIADCKESNSWSDDDGNDQKDAIEIMKDSCTCNGEASSPPEGSSASSSSSWPRFTTVTSTPLIISMPLGF